MKMLHPNNDTGKHALKNQVDSPMDKKKEELTGPELQADMEREVDARIKDKPEQRKKAAEAFTAEEDKKDKVKVEKMKEEKDAAETLVIQKKVNEQALKMNKQLDGERKKQMEEDKKGLEDVMKSTTEAIAAKENEVRKEMKKDSAENKIKQAQEDVAA